MKRPKDLEHHDWQDPFWHALRLLLDQRKFTTVDARDVVPRLRARGTDASIGLADYLSTAGQHLVDDLAAYSHLRFDLAEFALADLLRTEDEAQADYAEISTDALKQYTTQIEHYQSSKVLVATVDALAARASKPFGQDADLNPQARAALLGQGRLWVSPRRLDGALPSLWNPVGLWEVKEYWGKTGGGSKMSDAIYEIQLVGTELRLDEAQTGQHTIHVAILDGKEQWKARRSDLRRAIDLLYSGLLDELIIGREVLTDWEPLVERMWQEHIDRP